MASERVYELDEIDQQIVEEARLRFPPPYVECSTNPKGFEFHWIKMQYAFNLPDPATIQPIKEGLDERDSASIRRFVDTCRELSSYSLLNHGGGVSVTWDETKGESVEIDNPPKEALRGFSVLFRQIHDDTNASFKVVSTILERLAARAQDEGKEDRQDFVRRWRAARRALVQRSLHDIAQSKILRAKGAPPELADRNAKHSPLELLSLFNYGEYIHWGEKRDKHAAIVRDPTHAALLEFDFHMVMIGLAHFYLGYAKVLEYCFLRR